MKFNKKCRECGRCYTLELGSRRPLLHEYEFCSSNCADTMFNKKLIGVNCRGYKGKYFLSNLKEEVSKNPRLLGEEEKEEYQKKERLLKSYVQELNNLYGNIGI